ncbi:hypothetical protein SAMN05192561_1245 [Halopenitus malekzadehii]|uniref:Uncharacterized protein n=1 Tax=Halopenitus malekzadehii TaxID=1267564 RepID=A0A1H6K391_9EURY|nr:hypothetical protein [Halopenitus malekzadehii]SEH66223.1 hypothetical protein SAMN05192561_1245 [Halopenitus malekzadehii]
MRNDDSSSRNSEADAASTATASSSTDQETSPSADQVSSSPADQGTDGMRARTWVIAARYREPTDYGIPTVPAWAVSRTEDRGIALAATADADPFIRADCPMPVRR